MKHIVTLSDKNYIIKGLTLFESLEKFSTIPFTLHYLCLDNETFNIINNVNNIKLIPYHINNITDEILQEISKNCENKPNDLSDFHFTLSCYFTNYIIEHINCDDIMYIDSDIIFYEDIKDIYTSLNNKSIGIIMHRHNEYGCYVGCYNVGIIYFNNDKTGRECLRWWRDVVVNKNNQWFNTHGHLWDQKYLELFEVLFDKSKIKIIDDDIGHGAPWNFNLYSYIGNNKIIWNGKEQKMYFIHFSHFVDDYINNSYKESRNGEWFGVFNHIEVKQYYDKYFEELKNTKNKYKI